MPCSRCPFGRPLPSAAPPGASPERDLDQCLWLLFHVAVTSPWSERARKRNVMWERGREREGNRVRVSGVNEWGESRKKCQREKT